MCDKESMERIEDALVAAATAEVRAFKVKPGDTLHVRVGIPDMGDGQPPWVPSQNDLDPIRDELEGLVPEGVNLWVTHFGIEIDAVVKDDR